MEWCVYKHMLLDVVVGPGCLCLPQHLHLFIYARLQYIGETLRAVALLDNLSFFCIHPRHMSACLPAAYGVFGTGCHGCRNFSVFVLCWSEFLKVCVRDGSICDCIVTTTIVHKSRNLWQTRLCIRRSHALTFLLHSNTSIIVGEQLNAVELFDTIWYRFGAKELWRYKVTPLCSAAIALESHLESFAFWVSDKNLVFK